MGIKIESLMVICIIATMSLNNSEAQDNDSNYSAGTTGIISRLFTSNRIDTSVKGDYTQLRYTIRMNRPGKYKQGEPIFISAYVKNMSDSPVHIMSDRPVCLFSADKVSLVDAEGNEVPMTRIGKRYAEWVTNGVNGKKTPVFHNGNYRNYDGALVSTTSPGLVEHLHSQNERKLKPDSIVLNHYFDMTQPGVYHLTFHRISFHENQKYDEPLASNTLTIEVLDEPVTPDDLKDPGEFNFPAPEKADDDVPKASDASGSG